jgi:Uma2 family endonuclease
MMARSLQRVTVCDAELLVTPSAEQIMARPLEVERRWTAREVRDRISASQLATPRYELVDGELLVTPSPSAPHQEAVKLLLIALEAYLSRNPVGHVVHSPSDVELAPGFITQPDVFVAPTTEWRRVLERGLPYHELMVAAEMLSPSSGRYDRVTKRVNYQRHVPEYWIFDLDARLVERWTPRDQRPEVLTETLVWSPVHSVEPFTLELIGFFRAVFGQG